MKWLLVFLLLLTAAAGAQQIAFTFDDLPSHSTLPPGETRQEVAEKILSALKNAGMPPTYGFVNAVRMEEQPDTIHVLEAWRKAGNPLGNHSWSHMNLDQHTVLEFEGDVLRGEPALKQQMGAGDWHWFRFPYLAEGAVPAKRASVRAFLAEHGYKVAAVTMSFGDYAWNEPYARCSAKHDDAAIARLEASYLEAARVNADDSQAKAKELLGRDLPYVLLMHLGAFDARMLPRLLELYRERGFSFVTLEQAERDPFYKPDVDLTSMLPDTLEGALTAAHKRVPASPGLPAELATVCR
jgi:peptidoglycan/xylan/chitin deacetylase (PgdA/CDA1 family)